MRVWVYVHSFIKVEISGAGDCDVKNFAPFNVYKENFSLTSYGDNAIFAIGGYYLDYMELCYSVEVYLIDKD